MYNMQMKITFDSVKNERIIRERGLPFHLVEGFDWHSALVEEDARKLYKETRYETIGFIGGRLFVVIFTPTDEGIRVISFRKANQREVKRYEKTQP